MEFGFYIYQWTQKDGRERTMYFRQPEFQGTIFIDGKPVPFDQMPVMWDNTPRCHSCQRDLIQDDAPRPLFIYKPTGLSPLVFCATCHPTHEQLDEIERALADAALPVGEH